MHGQICWIAMRMTLASMAVTTGISIFPMELCGQDIAKVAPEATAASAFFGGQVVRLRYRIDNPDGRPNSLTWSVAAGGRTLAVGESELKRTVVTQSVVLEIPLPVVRDGVVLETTLSVKLLGEVERLALAKHSRKVFIYGRNPFAQRKAWLKALDIRLYDPLGDTAVALDSEEIPFERVLTADALVEVRQGMVVIGEGNSAKILAPAVSKLMEQGIAVLWLAPATGELPIAHSEEEWGLTRPDRLVLCDVDMIEGLSASQQLFAEVHSKCRFTTQSPHGLRIVSSKENELAHHDWNWVECRYRHSSAVMVICGLAIIQEWNSGPASQYGLAQMLKYLSKSKSEKK